MKIQKILTTFFLTTSLLATASIALAFDSGSSGVDGAFEPTIDTVLSYPEGGIFHFTTVNIPSNVTVTFSGYGNSAGYILASGDVVIDGNIDMSGGQSVATNDTDKTADGLGGSGGVPGGYDGGRGGFRASGAYIGYVGHGPGRGLPGTDRSGYGCGAGGAGYANKGGSNTYSCNGVGGDAYISLNLFPLLGGSGGGGGGGSANYLGSGGGGGGGALLIASSATITINGTVDANGGNTGSTGPSSACGGAGGGGSGGAIRLLATSIIGTGNLKARGGVAAKPWAYCNGGNGANGVIRLEAEQEVTFAGNINITPVFSNLQPVFLAGLPGIRIVRVGGIEAPVTLTGLNDIILPEGLANPTAIEFSSIGLPVGTVITLVATPRVGQSVHVESNPVTGTEQSGTAVASINIPDGHNILFAWATFTVTEQQASALSIYTEGEQVATVSVNAEPGKGSMTTFTTVSGKQYIVPSNVVAM